MGLTEEDAKKQLKGDLDVYVSKFKPLKNTLTGRDERTLMKMIVHVDTDEVYYPHPRVRQNLSLQDCCAYMLCIKVFTSLGALLKGE